MKKQFIIMMASVLMLVGSGQVMAETQYTITDLGTLGGSLSYAYGINDSGQVVGVSWITGNSTSHAFLYDGGNMIDLNTLLPTGSGWVLKSAYGINDSGQIVGYGSINGSSDERAFLMTPVPEPTTLLLLGLGGLMLRKRI